MRSKRFSRRSSQKIVVNGVRVDAAYLKQQAEKKAVEAEALRRKRLAVRRKPKPRPRPKPEPVIEPAEEVAPAEVVLAAIAGKREEVVAEDTSDVEEDE